MKIINQVLMGSQNEFLLNWKYTHDNLNNHNCCINKKELDNALLNGELTEKIDYSYDNDLIFNSDLSTLPNNIEVWISVNGFAGDFSIPRKEVFGLNDALKNSIKLPGV